MQNLPFFPFYTNDWLSSAKVQTLMIEMPNPVGCYIFLLCEQWNAPTGVLPSDPAQLAQLSRAGKKNWALFGHEIINLFFTKEGNTVYNEKLYGIWQKHTERVNKCRAAGLESARHRGFPATQGPGREGGQEGPGSPGATQGTPAARPGPEAAPGAAQPQAAGIKGPRYSQEFELFWQCYPRKVEKLAAFRKFQMAKRMATAQQIMDGVRHYKAYIKKQGVEEVYIKHPATWLNRGCWADDYVAGKPDNSARLAGIMEKLRAGEQIFIQDYSILPADVKAKLVWEEKLIDGMKVCFYRLAPGEKI